MSAVMPNYARELRGDVPAAAFAPTPWKLCRAAAHVAVLLAGYSCLRLASNPAWLPLVCLVIGQSLACLAFLAHELSHGVLVRSRGLRYGLELLVWGIVFIPATVWRRVHNQTHHVHASTPKDPDRPFLRSESSTVTRWYTRLFHPSREGNHWNPLVFLHLVPYVARNLLAAFTRSKPAVVPCRPSYSARQRACIVLELGVIAGLQVLVFRAVGSDWIQYLWASPLACLLTSAITMAYIFTNHFLNPIAHEADVLEGTTSVRVPRVFDYLHQHFSYHTEHHLYPGMNSDHYPLVFRLSQQRYPAQYHRMELTTAWQQLWQGEAFVDDLPATPESQGARPGSRPDPQGDEPMG